MWVAKDNIENSKIKVYKTKPNFKGYYFDGLEVCELPSDLFPELTFENSPKQIELK